MTADIRDILHTPYELGGRTVGLALDCLGAVGSIARRRGLPPPDGWPSMADAWRRGDLVAATGFPAGWVRQPPATTLLEGDVLVFVRAQRAGCAIVHGGMVVSADPRLGVYCTPLDRWGIAPAEVWRFTA